MSANVDPFHEKLPLKTKEELEGKLFKLMAQFEITFGEPISLEAIEGFAQGMLLQAKNEFLTSRFKHMKEEDLVNMVHVIEGIYERGRQEAKSEQGGFAGNEVQAEPVVETQKPGKGKGKKGTLRA